MVIMYILAKVQQQCQRSWYYHQVGEPLLSFLCIAVTVSLWRPYAYSICSMFPLCMESNASEKSTNNVASRFFTCTPSIIWLMARICDVVNWFLQKLFWFFQRIFSISGLIWWRSRALQTLAPIAIRVMPM